MNTFLKRQAEQGTNSHGKASEKRLAKKLGAQLTPASGAVPGFKGDMRQQAGERKVVVESKSTIHDTMKLDLTWLMKVQNEALTNRAHAALTVSFVTPEGKPRPMGEWVMMPIGDYQELIEAAGSK